MIINIWNEKDVENEIKRLFEDYNSACATGSQKESFICLQIIVRCELPDHVCECSSGPNEKSGVK